MNNTVYLYDSMSSGSLSDQVKIQLASLYRREAPHNLDVNVERIQQQQGGSDCGLFAPAVCLTLAFGGNPTLVKWRQNRMRVHLKECFEAMHLIEFPSTQVKIAVKRKTTHTTSILLVCVCRLPKVAFEHTLKCLKCQTVYHSSCVVLQENDTESSFSCYRCK